MKSRALALPAALLLICCSRAETRSDTVSASSDSTHVQVPLAAEPPMDTSMGHGSASGTAVGRPRGGGGGRAAVSSKTAAVTSRKGGALGAIKRRSPSTSDSTRTTDSARTTRMEPSRSSSGDSTIVPSSAADSVRGIVAVVGTSFDSHVILRPAAGGRAVTLVGAQARTVGRLSGADVWLTGTRDDRGQITVSRFLVRSVDGAPALDGTLIARGDQLLLVTRDGKQHPIANPPPALREHVGARVWITGPLDKGPLTFGVIEERR